MDRQLDFLLNLIGKPADHALLQRVTQKFGQPLNCSSEHILYTHLGFQLAVEEERLSSLFFFLGLSGYGGELPMGILRGDLLMEIDCKTGQRPVS